MSTQYIRGLHNIKKNSKGVVLTIGNFDGVHLGHKLLIEKLKQESQRLSLASLVITFEPQPLEYFVPSQTVPRLTRLREKFYYLAETQVDAVLFIRFNADFAQLTAEAFIQRILVEKLNVQEIVVGEDFQFGAKRSGNVQLLEQMGSTYGYSVKVIPSRRLAGDKISSTRVRKALLSADFAEVERLLGRPFTMMGRIGYGSQLGRTLGFPTANIYLHRKATPVHGIYVVRLYGIGGQALLGVANVGTRPTVGGTRILLEVYLFNFNQNIYGKYVTVEFCQKLRDEVHFANLELLKNQMTVDVEEAKNFFVNCGEL